MLCNKSIQYNKMANTKKQYEFCEDIFKQIIAYANPLATCSRKKCNFVATETCEFCDDVCCRNCMVEVETPLINRIFAVNARCAEQNDA